MPVPIHEQIFDVAVCGGGLAGSTLARQLVRHVPDLSIVVLDRLERPLPEAAFKVGESLVESGSHYLLETVGLRRYLEEHHVRKCGFRFFFQNGEPFHRRPEYGLSGYPRIPSYQLDRGVLENDLRRFNEEAGVTLLEGCAVTDIALAEGDGPHRIEYERLGSGETGRIEARWVVDAMGRRRFLQKRLGLGRRSGFGCSSAWFRLDGRLDVESLVPPDERAWFDRVPDGERYDSTNHLMGDGYWVWLIPLGSGHTSVGIVAIGALHPFDGFNTYERARDWLARHEPALHALLGDVEPLDFRTMREYSYTSERLFSEDRWAIVGEAGLFPDPFYSLASDLIGFANTAVVDLVARDREGRLDRSTAERYDRFVLGTNHWLTHNIQTAYPYFGRAVPMANKVMWDTATGWSTVGPQMYNGVFLDEALESRYREASKGFFFLTRTMQTLFVEWGERAPGRLGYDFIDFLSVPMMRDVQTRNLRAGKSDDEIVADQRANMRILEEMAQAIFLVAVEDVLPEALDRFEEPVWLNAWAIGLDPAKWESAGLFRPTTEPRDLEPARRQIRGLFRPV